MTSAQPIPTSFVFVGIQSWDLPLGGNAKDMALELSKTNRVLYVNPSIDRITAFRQEKQVDKRRTESAQTLVKISETCWVFYPDVLLESINWLPDNALFDWLNKVNNRRMAKRIQWAVDQLGFGPFTLFNDSDMFRSFYLKELLSPQHYVYYTRDNLMAVDYWKKHGQRLEASLMRKADLVVSNSAYLARLAHQHNAYAVDIGQGCDLTQFDATANHPIPDDLKLIAPPRIGYVGALNANRLDIDWLVSMAQERPDWNLLLIGPQDDTFRKSDLHRLANVYFLGSKPMQQLPAYLQHLDVAINPQRLNDLTIGNYPRKVDEYLAMGKPVVARQTETMCLFSNYVFLAETSDQFVAGIEKALHDELSAEPDACIEFAQEHTWARSIATLLKAIRNVGTSRSLSVNSVYDEPFRINKEQQPL